MGPTSGSWLPALPDGTSMGAMPAGLHDRYVDLYQKFGKHGEWPPPRACSITRPARRRHVHARRAGRWRTRPASCRRRHRWQAGRAGRRRSGLPRGDSTKRRKADCVFDVRVTGETAFAKTYLAAQRITTRATTITLRDDRDPTKYGQPLTFTATVALRSARDKRVRRDGTVPGGR